jgi:uncharacterized GH25 family protein
VIIVVSSYLYDLPGGGISSVSPRDEPERLTDSEGRCLVELPREVSGVMIWAVKDGLAPGHGDVRWEGEKGLVCLMNGGWRRQEVRPGSAPTVTLELEPGQPIGGLVKDNHGRPIAGAEVTVAFGHHTRRPDADLLTPSNWSADGDFPYIRVKTDAEGRWRCSSLPADPGRNSALLLGDMHKDYVSDTGGFKRQLSLRTARAMAGVLPMKSGASVSGLVRDTKGSPVAGARVVLAYSNHPEDFIGNRTDAAGRFIFPHTDDHPPLWRWIIEVEATGFAPAWKVTSPKSKLPPVELSLTPGRPFYGRIVDRQGRPVAGIEVRPRWAYLDHLSWRAVSDAEGRFVWRDAPQEGDMVFELDKEGELPVFAKVSARLRRANLAYDPE